MRFSDMEESVNYVRKAVNESAFVCNYNADDMRRVKSQDWWIEDFLEAESGNAEAAAELFVACLQWRDSFGVQGIGTLELSEALAENFIYFHGCDLNGRNILWMNWSRYQFITTRRTAERILVYWLERHSMETYNAPFTFVVNFHGSDIRDVDLDFVEFIFTCVNYYYPRCVMQFLLYECPSLMYDKWQQISQVKQRPLCSYEIVSTCGSTGMGIYVPFKYLPPCMGGEDDYVFVMHGLPQCIYSRQNKKRDRDPDAMKSFAEDLVSTGNFGNSKKTVTFKTESHNGVDGNNNNAVSTAYPSTSTKVNGPNSSEKKEEDIEVTNPSLGVRTLISGHKHVGSGNFSEKSSLMLKRRPKGDFMTELTLENRSRSGCQIFKVKTTAPQKFRVRPTLGIIPAGERQTICIVLDKSYEKSYRMERFLISTVLTSSGQTMNDDSIQDFAKIFSAAKPEETFQIKLNCLMEEDGCDDEPASSKEQTPSLSNEATEKLPNQSIDRELALFLAEREVNALLRLRYCRENKMPERILREGIEMDSKLTMLKQVDGVRRQLNINRVIIVVIVLIQAMMFLYFMKEMKSIQESRSRQ